MDEDDWTERIETFKLGMAVNLALGDPKALRRLVEKPRQLPDNVIPGPWVIPKKNDA